MQIPITKTIFDDAEKEAIIKPLETGWVVQGPNVAQFEKMFAEFTGVGYAKACTSCTTALHLGLEAMGIGEGDKVIVPSFTFIASANAVEYTGAKVVFCDIHLQTFNIDEKQIEKLIQQDPAIKAIMPVHLFGLCANMPAIMDIAKKHKLKVIEDAACGFDAWIGDKHAGTFGDCGAFSFHPRKAITTGEGGMLIANLKALADKAQALKEHGASKSDLERHEEGGSLLPAFNVRGYNYRMTDFQGALGVCQMRKAKKIMAGRREVAKCYDEALQSIDELVSPFVSVGYKHAYQSYVCLFTAGEDVTELTKEKIDAINIKRNQFMKCLEEKNIATRQGTHAVHTLGYYKDRYHLNDEDFLMSYAADRLSITLPLYAGMTDAEFNYVMENIKEALSLCVA